MSQTVTFDDVWKMFQEMVRENRERNAEFDRKLQERSAEFDRKLQERSAEFDRENRERSAEFDRKFQETERVVKEVSKQVGALGSRWGEFVEGLVAPACEKLFLERGIPVHTVSQRVRCKRPGNRHIEIDLLVVNSDVVVLVEVKSKLKHEDVRDHLERLAQFKSFFPEYADKQVMGAVAGITIEENVDRYAMNEGLFVIVQSGESVNLANSPDFQPRTW
ncbi:MAG: DUF3782 domain-containing protein [Magnetococcales bacterium]|nr:DUF3782 domain-containing protein [Magnetococcales bacterium]